MRNKKHLKSVIAVILMLFGMALYVLSDDEAIPLGEDASLDAPSLEMPAAE